LWHKIYTSFFSPTFNDILFKILNIEIYGHLIEKLTKSNYEYALQCNYEEQNFTCDITRKAKVAHLEKYQLYDYIPSPFQLVYSLSFSLLIL